MFTHFFLAQPDPTPIPTPAPTPSPTLYPTPFPTRRPSPYSTDATEDYQVAYPYNDPYSYQNAYQKTFVSSNKKKEKKREKAYCTEPNGSIEHLKVYAKYLTKMKLFCSQFFFYFDNRTPHQSLHPDPVWLLRQIQLLGRRPCQRTSRLRCQLPTQLLVRPPYQHTNQQLGPQPIQRNDPPQFQQLGLRPIQLRSRRINQLQCQLLSQGMFLFCEERENHTPFRLIISITPFSSFSQLRYHLTHNIPLNKFLH